jgi:cell wall-associated NlpC family hydrolase
MSSNVEVIKFAKKHLGTGGLRYRAFCALYYGAPYCNAFVTYCLHKTGNKMLYCDGVKQVSCPVSIKWCYKNLVMLPLYLAMPGDVIYFDWEPNGTPNHVGFVEQRISDQYISTIEGNTTSRGIVAGRKRSEKEVQGVFRIQYPADYKLGVLKVDGEFGYNSIAVLQYVLGVKVDGIFGLQTMHALQKFLGVKQDGLWGPATTKALQKVLRVKEDGWFGPKSTKAFQKYLNEKYKKKTTPKKPVTKGDKIAASAESYIGKIKYVLGGTSIKSGLDCTGFVIAMYGLHGIKLDNELSDWGKSIGTNIEKAKPGDILTFKNPKTGKVAHHGIYVGNGYVVHASTSHKDWTKDVCKTKVTKISKPLEGIRRRWK